MEEGEGMGDTWCWKKIKEKIRSMGSNDFTAMGHAHFSIKLKSIKHLENRFPKTPAVPLPEGSRGSVTHLRATTRSSHHELRRAAWPDKFPFTG